MKKNTNNKKKYLTKKNGELFFQKTAVININLFFLEKHFFWSVQSITDTHSSVEMWKK